MDECLPAEAVFRKERQTMIFRINDCLIDTDAYEVRNHGAMDPRTSARPQRQCFARSARQ